MTVALLVIVVGVALTRTITRGGLTGPARGGVSTCRTGVAVSPWALKRRFGIAGELGTGTEGDFGVGVVFFQVLIRPGH